MHRILLHVFCSLSIGFSAASFTELPLLPFNHSSIYAFDCNKDGVSEVVALALDSKTISVYDDIKGTFYREQIAVHLPIYPSTATTGDIDSDGDIDLVVSGCDSSQYGGGTVSILLCYNLGNSTFDIKKLQNSPESVASLCIGDIDGDKKNDLIIGTGYTVQAQVYKDVHNNLKTSEDFLEFGNDWKSFVVSDFDKDGDNDITACGTYLLREHMVTMFMAVYEKLDDGTYQKHLIPGVLNQNEPSDLSVVDIDKDGDYDIVCGSHPDDGAYLTKNKGITTKQKIDTTIQTKTVLGYTVYDTLYDTSYYKSFDLVTEQIFTTYFTHVTPQVIDFDGDNDLDIIVHTERDSLVWLESTPNGFTTHPAIVDRSGLMGICTFMKGNKAQVVTGSVYTGLTSYQFSNGKIDTLQMWPEFYPSQSYNYCARSDVDGNGSLDFVKTNMDDNVLILYHNNGNNYFTGTCVASGGYRYDSLNIARIMDKNSRDVIARWWNHPIGYVYEAYNSKDGKLYTATELPPFTLIADLNGDSLDDLINTGSTITVYMNSGNGMFSETNFTDESGSVTASDIDSDGDIDLINSGSKLTAMINSGNGTFTDVKLSDNTGVVTATDLDFDGDIDILFASQKKLAMYDYALGVTILLNDNNSGWLPAQEIFQKSSEVAGISYRVVDLNNDKKKDILLYYNVGTSSYPRSTTDLYTQGSGATWSIQDLGEIGLPSYIVDIDSDSDQDLLFTENAKEFYLQDKGAFTRSATDIYYTTPFYSVSSRTLNYDDSYRFFDFDNDGDIDIFNDFTLYANNAIANVTPIIPSRSSMVKANALTISSIANGSKLSIANYAGNRIKVNLYTVTGRVISSFEKPGNGGFPVSIDLKANGVNPGRGIYICQVSSGNNVSAVRLEIQ